MRLCSGTAAGVNLEASDLLSIRDRLRREPLDHDVLDLIVELGLGVRKRGRRGSLHKSSPMTASSALLSNVGFRQAVHDARHAPAPYLADLAFAGRSNVGKSSLLNALSGKSCGSRGTIGVAAVANRPGVTRSLNFYSNQHGAQLVDLPGCESIALC